MSVAYHRTDQNGYTGDTRRVAMSIALTCLAWNTLLYLPTRVPETAPPTIEHGSDPGYFDDEPDRMFVCDYEGTAVSSFAL